MAEDERALLAVADRDDPCGVYASGDKIVPGRFGSPVAQAKVVLVGPALVGMTFGGDFRRRISLEPGCVVVQGRFLIVPDGGAVEAEEDVLLRTSSFCWLDVVTRRSVLLIRW